MYNPQPGDSVIVTHNKQQLAATVAAVEASGKIDARITARGPYFNYIYKFGPGDVIPANGFQDEAPKDADTSTKSKGKGRGK